MAAVHLLWPVVHDTLDAGVLMFGRQFVHAQRAFRHAISLHQLTTRKVLLLFSYHELFEGGFGGAFVGAEGGVAGVAEALALGGVGEKGDEFFFQSGHVRHLHGTALFQKQVHERLEVLHVRAEEDGLPGHDGFGGVLAAGGEEAFADDDESGEALPGAQLAGGVDQESSRFAVLGCRLSELGAAAGVNAEGAEVGEDGVGALDVTWDDEQGEVRMLGSELLHDSG